MKERIEIAHVDMDAFFASVEQVCHPRFRGKPLIICGIPYERSVVSTASYEARAYGIYSSLPVKMAKKRCPDGIFMGVDAVKYVAVAESIRNIFREFSPLVEVCSIDEAYINFKFSKDPQCDALSLKKKIYQKTGLSCSVGLSSNKFLAKFATELEKPDGFTVLTVNDYIKRSENLSVGKIAGIGESTASSLKSIGVLTIGQLRRVPMLRLKTIFGIPGIDLHERAWGINHCPVVNETDLPKAKSYGNSYTLSHDTSDMDVLMMTLRVLCDEVSARMRKSFAKARTITIKIRYHDFTSITRSRKNPFYISFPQEIMDASKFLFKNNYTGRPVRLLGVSATDVRYSLAEQLGLFKDPGEKEKSLWNSVDLITAKYGKQTIIRASQLAGKQRII